MSAYLKNFFNYKGRMARKEYFLIHLSIMLIYSFFYYGIIFFIGISEENIPYSFHILEYTFFSVILFFPDAKRLHDIEFSAWMYILILLLSGFLHLKNPKGLEPLNALDQIILLINLCCLCFLIFTKGTPGPNKYGPPFQSK